MGCTSSKQARRDLRRSRRHSLIERSFSLPIRYRKKHHSAAATTAAIGSVKHELGLCAAENDALSDEETMMKSFNDPRRDRSKEVAQAKASTPEKVERRAPRTPTKTPPNEPEVINAWELMEGLDDASPLHLPLDRSFSFPASVDISEPRFRIDPPPSPPEDSIIPEFDPEILSAFRRALEELSPEHPSPARSPELQKPAPSVKDHFVHTHNRNLPDIPKSTGIVRARVNAFQAKINAKRANPNSGEAGHFNKHPPGRQRRVVFYFTSLRGVRKTHGDCREVKAILRGYGVRVDERDVSMHAGFKDELSEMLGDGVGFGGSLPQVFVGDRYLGGAEEVRRMHEAGEMRAALEGCEMATVGKGGGGLEACEGCGDARFVSCEACSGSCKVFVEGGEEEEKGGAGFRRCHECNENGLVRCPVCC